MSSSKRIDLQGDLAADVYLSEAQNPQPLPYTLYTCILYSVYLCTQGSGEGVGRVEPERRLEGRQFTKLGRKIPK
jgi:hypothetical protein